MQYLLTEEEIKDLQSKASLNKRMPSVEKLQKRCTEIADSWSITYWDNKKAEIWGCIITSEYEHYCDECPVLTICPYPNKRWSK